MQMQFNGVIDRSKLRGGDQAMASSSTTSKHNNDDDHSSSDSDDNSKMKLKEDERKNASKFSFILFEKINP